MYQNPLSAMNVSVTTPWQELSHVTDEELVTRQGTEELFIVMRIK